MAVNEVGLGPRAQKLDPATLFVGNRLPCAYCHYSRWIEDGVWQCKVVFTRECDEDKMMCMQQNYREYLRRSGQCLTGGYLDFGGPKCTATSN